MPGSIRSSSTTSGRSSRTAGSARVPSPTTAVSKPSPRSTMVSISASAGSSSTTSTRDFMHAISHHPPTVRETPCVRATAMRSSASARSRHPVADVRARRRAPSTAPASPPRPARGRPRPCGPAARRRTRSGRGRGPGSVRSRCAARSRGDGPRHVQQQVPVGDRQAEPVDLQVAHPGDELPAGVLVQPGGPVGGVRGDVAVDQHEVVRGQRAPRRSSAAARRSSANSSAIACTESARSPSRP